MSDLYFLSETDLIVLREVIDWAKNTRLNPLVPRTRFGQAEPEDDLQSPDVYLAKVATGGLPAMEEAGTAPGDDYDQPGVGACDIYAIDDDELGTGGTPELQPVANLSVTVYNLSCETIEAGRWVTIQRTAFGKWVMTSGQKQARWIEFQVNDGSGFSVSDSSVSVDGVVYHDGYEPATAVTTVYNKEADGTAYLFSGDDDAEGVALYSPKDQKYYIVQMEC